MKVCRKCGETKPLEAFVKNKRSKDGRNARCKECFNEAARVAHARRMADPDYRQRRAAKSRAYCAANPEARAAATRRWAQRHPERARAKAARTRRNILQRDPDYFRNWYQRNIDKERERSRAVMQRIRRERPELDRKWRADYRARHLELVRQRERANTHQRRALKAATNGSMLGGYSYTYMVEFIAELLTHPCEYCGEAADTLDHVVPLSRGGLHIPANLAPACTRCNCSKSDRLLGEWNGCVSSSRE